MTTVLLIIAALALIVAAATLAVLVRMRRSFAADRARVAAAIVSAERQRGADARAQAAALERIEQLLGDDATLNGATVVIERSGHDVPNLRGIVLSEHADRWTLGATHAVGPNGDVPLEHDIVHVAKSVVLSVSEVRR